MGIILFSAGLHSAVPAMGAAPANPYLAVLAWDRSPDPEVSGYRVYYGTTSGKYSGSNPVGNLTTATITGLRWRAIPNFLCQFTAYYPDGLESANLLGRNQFRAGATVR